MGKSADRNDEREKNVEITYYFIKNELDID